MDDDAAREPPIDGGAAVGGDDGRAEPAAGRRFPLLAVVGAAVAVAIVIGGFLLLRPHRGDDSARSVADRAMAAVKRKDVGELAKIVCVTGRSIDASLLADVSILSARTTGGASTTGDEATVPVAFVVTSGGATVPVTGSMTLKQRVGGWCVSDLEAAP